MNRNNDSGNSIPDEKLTPTTKSQPEHIPSGDIFGDLPPGTVIGDYKIVSRIGQGGMGVVYKAFEISLKRVVALKVLHQSIWNNPSLAKRFRREAILAGNLSHPNIVTIYHIEDSEKPRFFTMEFVQGRSLQDKVGSEGYLDAHQAIRITLQACEALQYAHEHNIIHRDIKPSNMLLENHIERVRISDFGIAQDTSGKLADLTRTEGVLCGTPGFESPEQNLGRKLDRRTDIFSLGMTLYYMLTGQMAYKGQNRAEITLAFKEQKPLSPSLYNSDVNSTLDKIVLKMIDVDLETRYQNIRDVADDLRRIQSTRNHISSASEQGHRKSFKSHLVKLFLFVILISILIIFIRKYIGGITDQYAGDNILKCNELVAFISERGDNRDVYLTDPTTGDVKLFLDMHSPIHAITFSPDGERFALILGDELKDDSGKLAVANIDGTDFQILTTPSRPSAVPVWTPDSQSIIFGNKWRGLCVINADGSGFRNLTDHYFDDHPIISQDNVIYFTRSDELRRIPLSGGISKVLLDKIVTAAISPDNKTIISCDGGIFTYMEGQVQRKYLTHSPHDVNPIWSFDGRMITFWRTLSHDKAGIYVMNANGSGLRQLTKAAGQKRDFWPVWVPMEAAEKIRPQLKQTSRALISIGM